VNAAAAVPVELEALRVRLRGREVLAIDALRIERGEVLGLLGPNGAGTTTLLRVLAAWQRPSAGRACVLGHDLAGLSAWQRPILRRRIGYLPQLTAVGGELPLTVREVVTIGRTGIRGLGRRLTAEDRAIVEHWIERLGLADVADAAYTETSGGQQRRALLARVMTQEPELLLLDEPTAHLDLEAREQIVRVLGSLQREAGLPVVLVCHEVEVLPAACRKVLMLQGGLVRAAGAPEHVLTDATVRELYGPGLRVVHTAGRHAVLPAADGEEGRP
jgi:iron complex transport system ATP-binding protein